MQAAPRQQVEFQRMALIFGTFVFVLMVMPLTSEGGSGAVLFAVSLLVVILGFIFVARLRSLARVQENLRRQRAASGTGRPNFDGHPLLARIFQNRTHMRLAMMDRDFDANDYDMLLRLDDENGVEQQLGLEQGQIDRLPSFVVKEGEKGTEKLKNIKSCSVCLEEQKFGEHVRALPCFHVFHRDCIDRWLKTKATCPVCTMEVVF